MKNIKNKTILALTTAGLALVMLVGCNKRQNNEQADMDSIQNTEIESLKARVDTLAQVDIAQNSAIANLNQTASKTTVILENHETRITNAENRLDTCCNCNKKPQRGSVTVVTPNNSSSNTRPVAKPRNSNGGNTINVSGDNNGINNIVNGDQIIIVNGGNNESTQNKPAAQETKCYATVPLSYIQATRD